MSHQPKSDSSLFPMPEQSWGHSKGIKEIHQKEDPTNQISKETLVMCREVGSSHQNTEHSRARWHDTIWTHCWFHSQHHSVLHVWLVPASPFPSAIQWLPHQKRELGRLIGVTDNCTDELAYVTLPKIGRIQIRKSAWAIEPHKINDLAVQADLLKLNTAIDNRIGNKTPKLNYKGEVRATDLPNEVDIVDLPPPPPDPFEGDKDLTV